MAGRPDPVTDRQPLVIPLRFGVGEAPSAPTVPDTPPLGPEVVYFLEDEETLRKVPSMLPLLSGTVKSPRIPIQIEKQTVVALVDTGAEVSVLPSDMMTRLIGDGSRHTKLGEQKIVKPFANTDVVLKGPWLLSVAVWT